MIGVMFDAKVLLFRCCVLGEGTVGLEAWFPASTGGIEKLWFVRYGGDAFVGVVTDTLGSNAANVALPIKGGMVGIEFNGED